MAPSLFPLAKLEKEGRFLLAVFHFGVIPSWSNDIMKVHLVLFFVFPNFAGVALCAFKNMVRGALITLCGKLVFNILFECSYISSPSHILKVHRVIKNMQIAAISLFK